MKQNKNEIEQNKKDIDEIGIIIERIEKDNEEIGKIIESIEKDNEEIGEKIKNIEKDNEEIGEKIIIMGKEIKNRKISLKLMGAINDQNNIYYKRKIKYIIKN